MFLNKNVQNQHKPIVNPLNSSFQSAVEPNASSFFVSRPTDFHKGVFYNQKAKIVYRTKSMRTEQIYKLHQRITNILSFCHFSIIFETLYVFVWFSLISFGMVFSRLVASKPLELFSLLAKKRRYHECNQARASGSFTQANSQNLKLD